MRTAWPEDATATFGDAQGQVRPDGALDGFTPADAPADLALQGLMSALSENLYCAGWLTDLELALWTLANAGGGSFGMGRVTPVDAALLLSLAEEAGCWWQWDDEIGDPARVDLDVWTGRR